jgi:selenocysteine lyase/cysteine desulfurase
VDIRDVRRLTPAVENCAYFQTSGSSPKPQPVLDEVVRWMRFQNHGPALPWVQDEMLTVSEQTRRRVAQTINADPDEIMLSENTTVGVNVVAWGLNWRPGDNVILSHHEHPGNRIPWYHLSQRYGVELRFLPVSNDPDEMVARFEALLDDDTRLVSVSHVSRRTGVRLPARRLVEAAHRRGVPVLLDGAQAFGAIPVDVQTLGCDFYACSGHKYIMAPQGTGAFYIRRDRLDWLKPSWVGTHSEVEMDELGCLRFKDSARRFEFGTRHLAGHAGFNKALEIWQAIGWQEVFRSLASYTDYVKESLSAVPGLVLATPRPFQASSGIVTFSISGLSSTSVCASLMERERVLVSPLGDERLVRVSTHVFNTEEECDRLVAGLLRIIEHGY